MPKSALYHAGSSRDLSPINKEYLQIKETVISQLERIKRINKKNICVLATERLCQKLDDIIDQGGNNVNFVVYNAILKDIKILITSSTDHERDTAIFDLFKQANKVDGKPNTHRKIWGAVLFFIGCILLSFCAAALLNASVLTPVLYFFFLTLSLETYIHSALLCLTGIGATLSIIGVGLFKSGLERGVAKATRQYAQSIEKYAPVFSEQLATGATNNW